MGSKDTAGGVWLEIKYGQRCVLIVFSLCSQQVEWLEKKYGQQLGVESAKLLQIYRLLAGQVDDVLE